MDHQALRQHQISLQANSLRALALRQIEHGSFADAQSVQSLAELVARAEERLRQFGPPQAVPQQLLPPFRQQAVPKQMPSPVPLSLSQGAQPPPRQTDLLSSAQGNLGDHHLSELAPYTLINELQRLEAILNLLTERVVNLETQLSQMDEAIQFQFDPTQSSISDLDHYISALDAKLGVGMRRLHNQEQAVRTIFKVIETWIPHGSKVDDQDWEEIRKLTGQGEHENSLPSYDSQSSTISWLQNAGPGFEMREHNNVG